MPKPDDADQKSLVTNIVIADAQRSTDTRDVYRDQISDEKEARDNRRHLVSEEFERNVTETLKEQSATLRAQDRILAKVEVKLESPVLNGGFDSLVRVVDRIEHVTEKLQGEVMSTNKKVTDIHTTIYEPEKGMIAQVNAHSKWISTVTKAMKWFLVIVCTGILTGIGKLIYDYASHHLHLVP